MSGASSSSSSSATATADGGTASANASAQCTAFVESSTKELSSYLHGDYSRVIYTVTLAVSSLLLMIILICFAPLRRRSRNDILKGALWAAQALPYTVMAHTLGLMQSPPYKNKTYAIWAMLCLLIHGISNSAIYGPQDKQQDKKQVTQDVILLYLAGWSFYVHRTGDSLDYPLASVLVIAFLKFIFRMVQTSFAYSPSCRFFGLRRRTKLLADFMEIEHDLSESPNPGTMSGYKYWVKGDEKIAKEMANKEDCEANRKEINEKVVTVEKIWQCERTFLHDSDGGEQLRDMCLSFALFRLLAVKFRGFPPPKKHLSKTWALFQELLLPKYERSFRGIEPNFERIRATENKNYERTFRVVEDELSFLYDYFYTQYPLFFSDGKFFVARTRIYVFLELAHFLAALWIIFTIANSGEFSITYSFRDYYRDYQLCQKPYSVFLGVVDYDCRLLPAGIHFFSSCIFVVVYLVLQLWQLLNIVFSNWTMVWFICDYVQGSSWPGIEILGSLIRFVRIRKPKTWRRKMEQYDLLSSFKYRPTRYFLFSALVDMPKRGQKSQGCKKLDQYVNEAVLKTLMQNGPNQLTKGVSSLERNKIDSDVIWACTKSTTECILVWHVATSFCAMKQKYDEDLKGKRQVTESTDDKNDREVAECLSGYCAYLVAFLPDLLPDPSDASEQIFDKAISDARELLERPGRSRVMYEKLQEFGEARVESGVEKEDGIVVMGATLGMQLFSALPDERKRWEALVDFWAEMMLFLAPSDNRTAHAESLANGGEFITHLWALLTHVGGSRKGTDRRQDDNSVPVNVTGREPSVADLPS